MPSWKINCLKSGDGIGLSTTIGKNKKWLRLNVV